MNKYKETYGVDISKDVFDVHGSNKVIISIRTMKLDSSNTLENYLKVHWLLWKLLVIIITDLHSFFTRME